MIKRFISAMLCLVLFVAAFALNASATVNRLDTKVADVKIYVENDKVENGDAVVVTIYVENITAPSGILAADLPLTYDKSKLSFVKLDCIYPSAWGPYGDFIGHATPDEEPWYLRSVPEANDMVTNPAYRIKGNKELGYKLTFMAVAEGDAYVAVEDVGNKGIMFVSIEDDDVVNYGGNGMKTTIKIGGHEESSEDPSSEVVSDDPSSSESTEDESSEVESTEDVSDDIASSEASDESSESGDDSSEETAVSEESSEAGGEESSVASEESKDDTDSKREDSFPFAIVIIGGVVLAAAAGIGGFLYTKKKKSDGE